MFGSKKTAGKEIEQWLFAIDQLRAGALTLLSLWGEPGMVHMALFDGATQGINIISLKCPEGKFPSVGRHHTPAIRLERTVRDFFGLIPEGTVDTRPWLVHGEPYEFLPVEGHSLHRIPVGPVHAGIIEPGHFRFTCNGETVVRLEQRLGYVHRGVEALMTGAEIEQGARLAARTSGDSTVAYGIAFARAVESATGAEIPARAVWLRALMAEMERMANHFGDIGMICNDASFSIMHAHCGVLREHVLRAAFAAFGHRLMMDRVVPGGVAFDIADDGIAAIRALVETIRDKFPPLVELYDRTTSLQDRTVTTGIVSAERVRKFGAGGHVGRASGRAFDSRKTPGYAPYTQLNFEMPVLSAGDVDARVWVRIREVEQSLGLIEQVLEALPGGSVHAPVGVRRAASEGFALAEAFRGDVFVWLRLGGGGKIERCHLRDASWFQWPLLEGAIEGNIVADFPLCNKSFNCSYAGQDL